MQKLEKIESGGEILVYLVRDRQKIAKTQFVSPPTANMQVGHIVYPAGGIIPRHFHKKIIRRLDRTEEVLIVRKGSGFFDVYDTKKKLIATRKVSVGDIMIIIGGGHGFRVIKDLILLEIKQGPYTGVDEKERF